MDNDLERMSRSIEVGYQVFLEEDAETCGAVRDVAPEGRPEMVV